jgi:hypothetical protein
MNELSLRAAAVTVGKPGAQGKRVTGLRIIFDIEKNSESTPNKAKVSIYNLSAKSRAEFEGEGLTFKLEAGYSGLTNATVILKEVFSGELARSTSKRQGADIVTTLEAADSITPLTQTTIEQSFAPGTSTPTVVQALAKRLGVAIGTIVPGAAQIFENGLTLTGRVSDNLDMITARQGLEWSVTDGELNILEPSTPTAELAILLTKATGLVGVPNKGTKMHGKGAKAAGGVDAAGVEFIALLDPEIKPGRAVIIQSDDFTGQVRVRRCKYHGDTHGHDWYVTSEGV